MAFNIRRRGRPLEVSFARWAGVLDPGQTERVQQIVNPAQWFAARGWYRITAATKESVVGMKFRVAGAEFPVPRFRNVASATGLQTVHQAVAETSCDFAAGAAWGDLEGDGDVDLYLPNQVGPAHLWVNGGGTFVDEASARGINNGGTIGIGGVFADYDNDGDQDLYAVNDGANRLFRNDGLGRFQDVALEAGVADAGPGASASWGDYDGDGYLDLYLTNYARCGQGVQWGYFEDRLYHNNANGTFTDVTAYLHATGSTKGAGFQAAWFDYDHDDDQDLYLANDFIGPSPEPNVLWRNDGPGPNGSWRFSNVSVESGAGLSINTMGIGVGDYGRDGDLDLVLSNIDASALLRNNGNGTFTDVAAAAGVDRPYQNLSQRSVTWGLAFADLNLDGWEDLYVVGGAIMTSSEEQPNGVFVGRGKRFLDLSAPSRANEHSMGRGLALADYDRDGRVDLFVVNRGGSPLLYRNVTSKKGHHWLQVDTVGTKSNRDACGARLTARLERKTRLVRQVFCGSIGLSSGSDPTVHFGLGEDRRVKRLTIEWPSGTVQVLRNVRADRLITVTEPI